MPNGLPGNVDSYRHDIIAEVHRHLTRLVGNGGARAFVSRAEIADLLALQNLDDDLVHTQSACESLRKKLEADRTLETRSALGQARRQVQSRERALREAEDMLEETVARLKRQEGRLYGGGATPKELGALQEEIAHLNTMNVRRKISYSAR